MEPPDAALSHVASIVHITDTHFFVDRHGETLTDYNFRQTSVGAGVMFSPF